jgi:anti-anti-sigma factor
MPLLGSNPHEFEPTVSASGASGTEQALTITTEIMTEAVIVIVAGEVDPMSAERLAGEIVQALGRAKRQPVVVDLGQVSYFGSGGWGALVSAYNEAQRQDRTLRIVIGHQDAILRSLQMLGLDRVLPVYEAMPEALRRGTQS